MKAVKLGLALAVAGALVSQASFAGNDKGKVARSFDVCVDSSLDAKLTTFPPTPGDRVTAVGMLLPVNTLVAGAPFGAPCGQYQDKKIGNFFVNGTFVADFSANHLPQAAADDLAYVQWHFRADGVGAFETSGPIKQFVQGGTYPQVITGGTGRFRNVKGEMTTVMLGAAGFQIRVILPQDD